MRVINKKMVVVVLLIIEFACGYLMYQSSKKEVDLAKVTYEEEIKDSMFAMYIENDEGNYEEAIDTGTFPEGYILNMDKTGCIDNKGNSISDILTSKDDKVMVKSNKTVFCYLYFDKDNRVYTQVKSDYKNNTGALLLSETESDEYPVYYYSGDITNNNILYANFCWKMVRTTETGGVKLIYNGVPDEAEDGTLTCDNTGEESQIGTSAFNSSYNSLAYSGYMYNSVYANSQYVFNVSSSLLDGLNTRITNRTYYYGDTATWDGTEGVYKLSNSDGSDLNKYLWSENYIYLREKYTCRSENDTNCEIVSYVASGDSNYMWYYDLSDGNDYDDYKIKLATSVKKNDDETYTLVEPIEVIKVDYAKNYSNYKNYYACRDLVSDTCSDMYYAVYTSSPYAVTGLNMAAVYKYGNSVEYKDGKYILVDTIEFWDWSSNYNKITNNHYTCFNATGVCEEVYYIYVSKKDGAYRITLSDGKTIESAINEMLYAEDVNKSDSLIKTVIDTWYEESILDKIDGNEVLYSSYLENTIWCNNREIINFGGFNPDGGSLESHIYFNNDTLYCSNKLDQFTLKVEAGGIQDYGNNALDYPIALLTSKEYILTLGGGYLQSKSNYWLMMANIYTMHGVFGYYNNATLNMQYASGVSNFGVRPSISLTNKVEITNGNGTVDNPYQIILPS